MAFFLVEYPFLDGFHRPIARNNLQRSQAIPEFLAGYNQPLESIFSDLFIGQPAAVRTVPPTRTACTNCCRNQQQQQRKPQPSTSKSAKCSANVSACNSANNSANQAPNPCLMKKIFGGDLLKQFCPAAESEVKNGSGKQADSTTVQEPINLDTLLAGLLKNFLQTVEADKPNNGKEEHPFQDILDLLAQFTSIEDKVNEPAKQPEGSKNESAQQAADKCDKTVEVTRSETKVESVKPAEKASASAEEEPSVGSIKHIELDLQKFKPENVQIKVLGDQLLLEAWREEEDEDGLISKLELKREFKLPEQFDLANIQCLFARDGKLKIAIPTKKPKKSAAIVLPIRSEKDEQKADDSVASATQSDESWEKIAVEPDTPEIKTMDPQSSGLELD